MADDAARRDANRHPALLALEQGSNELRAVRVDSFGRLVVTGGGAEPTASTLKVADGTTATQLLAVDTNGRIGLNNNFLTDAQLRATAVPVSGPLTDAQLRATPVAITGPVTGPLTDAQLRATSVPVTGPLTNTQLRATAVPVSGPLTDTQLRATPVPVSGTVAVSNPTANPETGLAKEVTLASVLAAVDTLEALTTDLRTELRRRPLHKSFTGVLSIPPGTTAYTTVTEFTPTVDVTITGFNADFLALISSPVRYRVRLITGTDASPMILVGEELSTEVPSWVPFMVDIAANTRIALQTIHGEVTAQDFRGTVAYCEEP